MLSNPIFLSSGIYYGWHQANPPTEYQLILLHPKIFAHDHVWRVLLPDKTVTSYHTLNDRLVTDPQLTPQTMPAFRHQSTRSPMDVMNPWLFTLRAFDTLRAHEIKYPAHKYSAFVEATLVLLRNVVQKLLIAPPVKTPPPPPFEAFRQSDHDQDGPQQSGPGEDDTPRQFSEKPRAMNREAMNDGNVGALADRFGKALLKSNAPTEVDQQCSILDPIFHPDTSMEHHRIALFHKMFREETGLTYEGHPDEYDSDDSQDIDDQIC